MQTVKEHSMNTASLCEGFAIDPLKRICALIGLLHDIGKYQDDFQKHILKNSGKAEHSIAGAQILQSRKDLASLLMQLCISGHHTGIPDCGLPCDDEEQPTLYGRLKRRQPDYSVYLDELSPVLLSEEEINNFNAFLLSGLKKTPEDLTEKFAFLVRYCFSCLADADSTDAAFASGESTVPPLMADFDACLDHINKLLCSFENKTQLQKARSQLQAEAYNNISKSAAIYLMNMPTGSGKTLCSMKCALHLVKQQHLKRIIYVIPYNSIIDQTAEIFTKLFGADAQILRHQSSFSYASDESTEDWYPYAVKASENWDAQIIITTAVQFFESVYSSRRSKLRKIHNIANSVLVFDEAHLLPREYLQPCLNAVRFLTDSFHCKAIFLTATMPDYEKLLREYSGGNIQTQELISDKSIFRYFRKAHFTYIGSISNVTLIEKAKIAASSLIVVNTKKSAREIYSSCTGNKFYLSTYLTGFDRRRIISNIRTALAKLYADYPKLNNVPEERKITVVSTSLIEAGVDFDFVSVFRELAGIDNILQAGGRCNREGLRADGNVYVFRRSEKETPLNIRQAIGKDILEEYSDISSPEAIADYYNRLFFIEKELHGAKSISKECKKPDRLNFRTYDDNFRFISDAGTSSIVVCRDEYSRSLLEGLRYSGNISIRAVQQYTCTINQQELQSLIEQGVAADYGSGVFFLLSDDYYDEETGIQFTGNDIYF